MKLYLLKSYSGIFLQLFLVNVLSNVHCYSLIFPYIWGSFSNHWLKRYCASKITYNSICDVQKWADSKLCLVLQFTVMTHLYNRYLENGWWKTTPTTLKVMVRKASSFRKHFLMTDSGSPLLKTCTILWRQVRFNAVAFLNLLPPLMGMSTSIWNRSFYWDPCFFIGHCEYCTHIWMILELGCISALTTSK